MQAERGEDCYIVSPSVWSYITQAWPDPGVTSDQSEARDTRVDQSEAGAYPPVSIHILNMLIQILKLNLVENIPACILGRYSV